MYPEHPTCTNCSQECDPVIDSYEEKVEFWGGITYERFYEVTSDCCDHDVELPVSHDLF